MEAMTGKSRTGRALGRLAEALVDDIMNASDEEILAEFLETDGDLERHAADMRALFEKALIAANKKYEPTVPYAEQGPYITASKGEL